MRGKRAWALIGTLAALLFAIAPATGAPQPGTCPIVGDQGETVWVKCAVAGGRGGSDQIDPPPPPSEADAGPRTCHFGATEVACSTYAGTWSGTCYVATASPQPPPSDPIWNGQTTGVIVSCTPHPCLVALRDRVEECPTRYEFWSANAAPVNVDEEALARQALAQLDLDPITLGMAPKPDLADPNVLIGAPAYFWAEGGTPAIGPISTTVTEQGITITLNATMDTVTYTTGDGTTLTCTRDQIATPPTNMTLQGTPDCGHRWESSGTYTLTATSSWTITWQGPTQNGTFDHTLEAAIDVAVTDRPVNLTTNKSP
jgi:hypothetical protein